MNVEFKNLKNNEWVITNDKGEMRLIKINDISLEEIKNIFLKENELESLVKEKDNLLQTIDKINNASIVAKKRNQFFKFLISFIGFVDLISLFLLGFSLDKIIIVLGASVIPIVFSIVFKLEALDSFGTKKIREELKNDSEESLTELKEREQKLVEEINMLKERYNFKEERKDVNYLEDTRYENKEEKSLVRNRVRH